MSCRVHVEGRQHNGIVLDLSGSGLFIQTSARLSPGARVDIDLSLPDADARMQVDVVRRKQVPAQLLTVAQGGIGVRIVSAPESYYRFLQQIQEGERLQRGETASADGKPAAAPAHEATPRRVAPAPAAPQAARAAAPAPSAPPKPAVPPKSRFRVHVCQTQGARSRVVDVAAVNAQEASREVLRDLGEDWKLLKVEPL